MGWGHCDGSRRDEVGTAGLTEASEGLPLVAVEV